MNLSIFSMHLLQEVYPSVDAAFAAAKALGISEVDIFESELDGTNLHDYVQFFKSGGLTVGTLMVLTDFATPDDEVYVGEIKRICNIIDRMAKEKISLLMVVPLCDFVDSREKKLAARERVISGLKELVDYADGSGVQVAIENFSKNRYPYSIAAEVLYILDRVHGLGYVFDSGNFYCVGADPLEAYDVLKEHITAVHIKDWTPDPYGCVTVPLLPALEGCSIGKGIVPIKELLARLAKDEFCGRYIIELNTFNATPEMVAESAEFINAFRMR